VKGLDTVKSESGGGRRPAGGAVGLSLLAVTWPIFVESALQVLIRMTDTFMLSKVSDDAVAAVGVSNQILMFGMLLFNFVAMGSAVVVSQYLGAGLRRDVGRLTGSSLALNLLFGLFVSAMVVLFCGDLLRLFGLEPELHAIAVRYLSIAGGGLFVQAVMSAAVAIIQSHGLTRQTMLVALGMNIIHIFGNWLVIFGPFGFPKLGVTGVAISTVVSQIIGMAVNLYLLRRAAGVIFAPKDLIRWKPEDIRRVLRIGVPASMNHLSYNLNQLVTTAFITSLGSVMLTTRIYTMNIAFIIMILCISLGRGMQIIVGHLVGAGEQDEAYRQVLRNYGRSVLVTLAAAAVISLFRVPLLDLFTDSEEIIRIGSTLLLLSFLLEPGRNLNIVFERCLQAAGDARFPAVSSVLIMWLFSVPLTYLLGIHFGYGLYGIWAAFIADEWARGIVLFLRWRSQAWKSKAIVTRAAKSAAG
jgi:putative MATE family efflux protein